MQNFIKQIKQVFSDISNVKKLRLAKKNFIAAKLNSKKLRLAAKNNEAFPSAQQPYGILDLKNEEYKKWQADLKRSEDAENDWDKEYQKILSELLKENLDKASNARYN